MTTRATRTLCFLSARNLGDAVFHADFVRALTAAGYAERVIVWTFAQAAFLFEDIAGCEIVISDFPMGATIRDFARGGFVSFLSAVRRIRSERPTETLELVADVRERWACRLLGAPLDLAPAFAPGHPFRRHSRMGRFRPSSFVTIPADVTSLYDSYDLVLAALLGPDRASFARRPAWPLPFHCEGTDRPRRIGIHPFASQACKLWPQAHWLALLDGLRARVPGVRIVLFGAPSDRAGLEQLDRQAGARSEIVTGSLREFRERLRDVDLLVGLDSFSVHLANSQGVPAMVLVGPNDPRLFTPPGARAVTSEGHCLHQPCGGKPKCLGTSFEYACMRTITSAQVLDKIAAPASARGYSVFKEPTH